MLDKSVWSKVKIIMMIIVAPKRKKNILNFFLISTIFFLSIVSYGDSSKTSFRSSLYKMLSLFCAWTCWMFRSKLICILTLYKHICIVRIWKPTKKQVDVNIEKIYTVMTAVWLFLTFDSNWAWMILKPAIFSVRFSRINRIMTYWLQVKLGLYLLKM